MIFYDFLFCSIRSYFRNKGFATTLLGVLAVVLTVMLHLLFIQSIVFFSTGAKGFQPADFSNYSANKLSILMLFILFVAIIFPFYREKRVKKITKLYNKKYSAAAKIKKLKKMYLFVVAPTVLVVIMNSWSAIIHFFMGPR